MRDLDGSFGSHNSNSPVLQAKHRKGKQICDICFPFSIIGIVYGTITGEFSGSN